MKIYVYTKTHTRMFTAAVCITAKTQKQPKCHVMGDCKFGKNKLRHIYPMDYYLAMKRNKLLIHPTAEMDPKGVMLSGKGYTLYNSIYTMLSR